MELLQRKLAAGHEALLADLRRMEWVVYAKRPFAGPEQVLDHFGRYTHRIAISNHRLVCHQDGPVTFRWNDYADDNRMKPMALCEQEFVRRFLQHVVPRRFVRIRHYGLLAARDKSARLARCRAFLPTRALPPTRITLSTEEFLRRVCSEDPFRGPDCRVGQMTSRGPLVRPPRSATSRARHDRRRVESRIPDDCETHCPQARPTCASHTQGATPGLALRTHAIGMAVGDSVNTRKLLLGPAQDPMIQA